MNPFFSWLVKNHLVYTLSWEDPDLDRIALELRDDDRVLMITGGGCNVLNFFLFGVKSLCALDLNPCQNALLELKLSAARHLLYSDFFAVFGNGLHPDFKTLYRKELRADLSPSARDFWDGHLTLFDPGIWRRRFYHRGTAGLAYKVLHEFRRSRPKLGRKLDELFFCDTLEDQVRLFQKLELRRRLDSGIFRWMFRRQMLMNLMAIPPEQFRQIEHRYPGGMPAFALGCIENVFTRTLLKENYFWHAAWFGQFTATCCPPYLREEHFSRLAKAGDFIQIHTASVADFLEATLSVFDKYVLLDHMDWSASGHSNDLTREWSAIVRTASSRARIIFRTAGPDAGYLKDLPIMASGRSVKFEDCVHCDTALAAELHKHDRVCIYGNFYVCTLNPIA